MNIQIIVRLFFLFRFQNAAKYAEKAKGLIDDKQHVAKM